MWSQTAGTEPVISPENSILTFSSLSINPLTICLGKKRNDNKNPNNRGAIAIKSKDFIDSIERVASVSIDRKEGVKLLVNKDNLQLSVNSANSGDGNEKIQANFSSENLNISFNSKYLIDIASEIENKDLKKLNEYDQIFTNENILITQENPIIELRSKKDICWDEYVLKYKTFEPLTPIQKEYKKVINNIDNATQENYKKFADAIDDGAELMFHYYPFGLREYVNLNNRLFLSCNKERFTWCYKLGLIKNNEH